MVNSISVSTKAPVKVKQPRAEKAQTQADSFESFIKSAANSQQQANSQGVKRPDAASENKTDAAEQTLGQGEAKEEEVTIIAPTENAALLAAAMLVDSQAAMEANNVSAEGLLEGEAAMLSKAVTLAPGDLAVPQENQQSQVLTEASANTTVTQNQQNAATDTAQASILETAGNAQKENNGAQTATLQKAEAAQIQTDESLQTKAASERPAETTTTQQNKGDAQEKATEKQMTNTADKPTLAESKEAGEKASDGKTMDLSALLHKEAASLDKTHPMKVKVGEGDVVHTEAKNFPNEMADKILFQTENGKTQFDMKLTPRELGEVNIKIIFEDGKATISMTCSNPKTANLLAQNAQNIGAAIEAHTGNQTTITVTENKENYEQQQKESYDGHNQNNQQEDAQAQDRHRSQRQTSTQDFVQKLRLGLVDLTEAFE